MAYDFRDVRDVTRQAEQFVQAAWKRIDPHDVAESWVFGVHFNRLTRVVVGFVSVVAYLATGKRQWLVESPAQFLEKYPLRAPAVDQRFPLA